MAFIFWTEFNKMNKRTQKNPVILILPILVILSKIMQCVSHFTELAQVYISGRLHSDVCVPFCEISLAPNEIDQRRDRSKRTVRVYDTAVHGAIPTFTATSNKDSRRYVQTDSRPRRRRGIKGRNSSAIDDGYLSIAHAENSAKRNETPSSSSRFQARPKAASRSAGHPRDSALVRTQGIITPEMEFIAIRENGG